MTAAAVASSPGERYAAGVVSGEWQDDPAQRAMLPALDRVWRELETERPASLWQRVRGHEAPAVRGVYLWGRVGRGKTFLCDLFHAALTTPRKRRVHFHRFMQDVHAQLRALEGRSDPLVDVAAGIAEQTRVLVLDEFFVGDIGDAMILANLLRALFARGVVVVTTSNTPPVDLYRDGLQRERFLPAIALIEEHCEVVELISAHDWRLRALKQAPVYLTPPDAFAERAMLAIFNRVARSVVRQDFELSLNDRAIAVRREADGAIWFDFDALCDGPRGVADYIELSKAYHTILVSRIPQFTPQTDDAARRFVELVDEVYDRGVNLVLSAAAPIVELYDGARLRAEFARTESRLIEMQSEEYLAREHRA
ncbi:MAG: cell division protein ZapE [Dokdonella sp.]|uniref:cell division protein ZapE n=1 Tax=Dokdonella sp. TaxID=2291710 RepID=UPI003267BD9D